MPGIFPDPANGGVVIRDLAGNCLNPPGVTNAYCPPLPFTTTCEMTALPDNCTARLSPAQINAVNSELVSFAACLDPDGIWNCASAANLCTAFNAWIDANPFSPIGFVTAICADDNAADTLASCLISADAGNIIHVGADGRIYASPIDPDAVVTAICADDSAADALSLCLIDPVATNLLDISAGGRLVVDPATVRAALCADPHGDALAACLISTDVNNIISQGADGRLRALATPINASATVTAICSTDAAADALAACMIDAVAPNSLDVGPSGRLMVSPSVVVTDILATDAAADALAAGMIDGVAVNSLDVGPSGRLMVSPTAVVTDICATDAAADALAACMISPEAVNLLDLSPTGRLLVDPATIVTALCTAPYHNNLASCLISTTLPNTLVLGADFGLRVPPGAFDPVAGVTAICGNDAAADALAACLISPALGNKLVTAADGRLYTPAVLAKTYISGMTTSNDAGDLVNDIRIELGECASSNTPPALISQAASMIKRLDAAWVAGTNQGGLDTGAVGNGTYHLHAMYNPTTGVSDYCFSLSATAPTTGGAIPVGFTHFRRIWSIVRIAGSNQLYLQNPAAPHDCYLMTPIAEVSIGPSAGIIGVLATLTTLPAGISVMAKLTGYCRESPPTAGIIFYLSSPLVTDVAAGSNGAYTVFYSSSGGGTVPQIGQFQLEVLTNTVRQVRYRFSASNAGITGQINCLGYVDTRGQL